MNNPIITKDTIKSFLFDSLIAIDNVISVTIVGSFIDKDDLSGISDIDTIIICNHLDKEIFNHCIKAIEHLNLDKCGLQNYDLKINPTFGPLKYDKPNLVVLHLMIYDTCGHKKHVLSSPFTCFDWERSTHFVGQSLSGIFPVGTLQIRDFKEARRGIENYLSDLRNGSITYREYNFENDFVEEVKKQAPIDKRHRGEFAFHIIRNLLVNYFKIINKKNCSLSKHEIIEMIKVLFESENSVRHCEKYLQISKIKDNRESDFPHDTSNWVRKFVQQFKEVMDNDWEDAIQINFIRHFKTNLNNDTFLGQGRDPQIDHEKVFKLDIKHPSIIYTSPMKRCLQSAKQVHQSSKIITDDRLLEFDYGEAEGLTYDKLINNFSDIKVGWDNGEDPYFPNGENTEEVFDRLSFFMDDLSHSLTKKMEKSISVFSHNGVLRCLIGNAFNINQNDWYKIIIPHGIPLEFLYNKGNFYPNIPRNILGKLLSNIGIFGQ